MLMPLVHDYLAVRRAMGFDLEWAEPTLLQFADFASALGETHIRAATAIEWAAAGGTAGERHRRLRRIVLLARYGRAEDPGHEIPPGDVFPRVPRKILPVIFTPDEARRLVLAGSRLSPTGSLRPRMFSALFALLFATGLRISEALALRFDDVTQRGLIIRETKFRKTRLVPLHETARTGLSQYLERRRRAGALPDTLFINLRGQPCGYRGVHKGFAQALEGAAIPRHAGRWPRIHDIRHTFAVRALEACPRGREQIARHMLALSTYLGHTRISDTYWYLQATPHLMRDIADACESLLRHGGRP